MINAICDNSGSLEAVEIFFIVYEACLKLLKVFLTPPDVAYPSCRPVLHFVSKPNFLCFVVLLLCLLYSVVVDCSFELNMCNWTQVNTTIAPVRWERTSEEILARFVDSYRTKHIAPMLKEFWAELNEPITGEST